MHSLAFLLLVATSAAGQAGRFEARVNGKTVIGEIATVAVNGTVTLADGTAIPGVDWYSLRRAPGVLPPWPRNPHIELNTGDRIRGTVAGADGDVIRLTVPWSGTPDQVLRFPLSAVRAAWLRSRSTDTEPSWLAGPRKRDVIQARNGDLTLGVLTAIDASKSQVRYQAEGTDREIPLSKVAAIGFNTDLARVRRPKGPFYRLTLADGTRISVSSLTFDGRFWTADTLFKESIKIPPDRVMSVDVEQGKAVYLSNLKPAKYQYQSSDGEDFAWSADRSVIGKPMRLKISDVDSTFDRGLGLHAECTVTYQLTAKYRRFETLAALDTETGQRGDAVLLISVDGKEIELPGRGRLTQTAGPIAVNVDVSGAKELTIAIRKGNGGIVQDHVNLVEARLVQ